VHSRRAQLVAAPSDSYEKRMHLRLAALIVLAAQPALAEPLPLPRVDYVATGVLAGQGAVSIRHRQGKLRLEIDAVGLPQKISGLIDLKRRRLTMMVPVPGVKAAMETGLPEDGGFGAAALEGKRTGSAVVAQEPCDLWETPTPRAEATMITCITPDGINLRTELVRAGERQPVLEIRTLAREPQDPALFALPADVRVMKAPAGLQALPGLAPPPLRPSQP
jgi:hypothetical protein